MRAGPICCSRSRPCLGNSRVRGRGHHLDRRGRHGIDPGEPHVDLQRRLASEPVLPKASRELELHSTQPVSSCLWTWARAPCRVLDLDAGRAEGHAGLKRVLHGFRVRRAHGRRNGGHGHTAAGGVDDLGDDLVEVSRRDAGVHGCLLAAAGVSHQRRKGVGLLRLLLIQLRRRSFQGEQHLGAARPALLRVGIQGAGDDVAIRSGQAVAGRAPLRGQVNLRAQAAEGMDAGQHLRVDQGQAVLVAAAGSVGPEQLRGRVARVALGDVLAAAATASGPSRTPRSAASRCRARDCAG